MGKLRTFWENSWNWKSKGRHGQHGAAGEEFKKGEMSTLRGGWLKDIPVPTMPAGSGFQMGFLCGSGDKGKRKHCEAGCKQW